MERGGEAQWLWTLSADSSGRGVIAVGITLTWISKDSGLPETTVSLWGQALEPRSTTSSARSPSRRPSVAGTGLLAVVGFVAQIPLIDAVLEVIGKLFFGGGGRRSGARSAARGCYELYQAGLNGRKNLVQGHGAQLAAPLREKQTGCPVEPG